MARNVTLGELIDDVRAEAGHSLQASLGVAMRDVLIKALQRQQRRLWEDHDWKFLRVHRDVVLSAGQRYYNIPSDLTLERIEKVEFKYGNRWVPVEYGIGQPQLDQYDSDRDIRALPIQRWQEYENDQYEIWPISSQDGTATPPNYVLRFWGYRKLKPLVAESDRADLDDILRFASISAVIDIVLGVAIAYVVVRSKIAGRQVLDFLAMLPLAVPGLVLAFGYLAMAQDGRFFSFLNPTRDPTLLLIIAYSVRRLPYVVRSAAAGFQQTSETLEEAAQNLGCPPLKAMVKVTLPLIAANLIAGGLLAFAFAMLEVSDSLILAQKQAYYPITKAILELFQLLGDGKFIASALGVWAMVFLGVTITGLSLLLGRRLGALFRV